MGHPDVSCGPPVTLGWNFEHHHFFKIEEYEKCRTKNVSPMSPALWLSPQFRVKLLLKSRTTRKEIADCLEQVRKDKLQRLISSRLQGFEEIEIIIENCVQAVKGFFEKIGLAKI